MRTRNALFIMILSAVSLSASAAQSFTCSLTHSVESPGQQPKVSIVNTHSAVTDEGKSFTFSTDGQKRITSPELQPLKMDDGETAMAAKVKDVTFVKLKESYVLRNKSESYVYSNCKPAAD
ncbi:hypothetical protein AAH450_08930 [Erwinia sp. P7711]|uniref:hypothetical protein n=1 Tax=Erwinia sp. P7711 TaxID=3141451 RepID=UPI003190EA05